MNLKVQLFEEVPIRLQVRDGNPRLTPIVTILGPNDRVLTELPLVHVINGLYRPADPFKMPDLDFIVVMYDTLDDFYELATEVFHVERPPIEPQKTISGIIISVTRSGMAVGMVVEKRRSEAHES
jgi:hypothetical protein